MPHTECKGCVHLATSLKSFFCREGVHQKIKDGLPVPAFGDCDFYKTDYSQ